MEENIKIVDTETPWNVVLSAKYKRSYAYVVVSQRMPRILSNIVEYLTYHEDDLIKQFGPQARQDIEYARFGLILLMQSIEVDNPLVPLLVMDRDVLLWNKYIWQEQLQSSIGEPCWFHSCWLFVECYFYRSIHHVFQNTLSLATLDPFMLVKMEELEKSKEKVISAAADLLYMFYQDQSEEDIHKNFILLLKRCLWGNLHDLSRPVIKLDNQCTEICEVIDQNVLVDDSERVWKILNTVKEDKNIIDIVNDNAGYELFCDLCLADYILTFGLADSVSFHFKAVPWFISDTMFPDFIHLMNTFKESHEALLHDLHDRWENYVFDGKWIIKNEMFWTLPHPYHRMSDIDLTLYAQLQHSKLIIFKGDVNYRKLLSEIKWRPSEPFSSALKGFHPTNLVSLRTVKCEIICGITEETAENLTAEDPNWMLNGKYGVIQYDGEKIK